MPGNRQFVGVIVWAPDLARGGVGGGDAAPARGGEQVVAGQHVVGGVLGPGGGEPGSRSALPPPLPPLAPLPARARRRKLAQRRGGGVRRCQR